VNWGLMTANTKPMASISLHRRHEEPKSDPLIPG
jgi:hypothetical protein